MGGGRTHQQAETETQSPGRMQSHPWPQPTPDSRPQWRQRRRAGRCQRVARRNPGDGRARETAQGPVGLPWPPPSRYLSLPGRCPGWSDLATVCLGLLLSPWTQASQRKDDSMSTSSRVLRSHRVTWTLLPAPSLPGLERWRLSMPAVSLALPASFGLHMTPSHYGDPFWARPFWENHRPCASQERILMSRRF